jgi:anti-anti-sigma regulatory factor
MLRLTLIRQTNQESVIKVEGWLSGSDVHLLEVEGHRCFKQESVLVLDLMGVCHVDSAGLDLLQGWWGQRLALRGVPAFVAALLRQRGLIGDGSQRHADPRTERG